MAVCEAPSSRALHHEPARRTASRAASPAWSPAARQERGARPARSRRTCGSATRADRRCPPRCWRYATAVSVPGRSWREGRPVVDQPRRRGIAVDVGRDDLTARNLHVTERQVTLRQSPKRGWEVVGESLHLDEPRQSVEYLLLGACVGVPSHLRGRDHLVRVVPERPLWGRSAAGGSSTGTTDPDRSRERCCRRVPKGRSRARGSGGLLARRGD